MLDLRLSESQLGEVIVGEQKKVEQKMVVLKCTRVCKEGGEMKKMVERCLGDSISSLLLHRVICGAMKLSRQGGPMAGRDFLIVHTH